jgi:uncharacterized membrane protein YdjX (TVP38/TMEM64 family)
MVSWASGTSPALVSMFAAAFLSRSLTIPQCRQRYTRSFKPIGGLAISPHSEQVCVVYAGLTGMNLRPFLTACQCSIWMSVAMAAAGDHPIMQAD